MNNNQIKFHATIDLAKQDKFGVVNPNYRTITLEDVSNYTDPLSELVGYFVIKDPLGNTIHSGDFASPDIDLDVNRVFVFNSIPLDAYANIVSGVYKFQLFIQRDNGGTKTDYHSNEYSVKVCAEGCSQGLKPKISLSYDCNIAVAKGFDNTKYKSGTTQDKTLTLVPPVGAKYLDGSDATPIIVGQSQVASNALWTGSWQLLLRSVITEKGSESNFSYEINTFIEETANSEATCSINICGLYSCIDNKYKELDLQASRKGGMSNNIELADTFIEITSLLNKFNLARECGKITQASKLYKAITEYLGCDCDCSDSNYPTFVYPLVNAPNGSNTVVEQGNYVSVVSSVVGNTTTYTVAISTELANLINLIKEYDIESSDGTIDVQRSDSGTSVLFDLTVDTSVIDSILGGLINATGIGMSSSEDLTDIVQELVDREANNQGEAPSASDDSLVCAYNTAGSVLVTANDFFSSDVTVDIVTNGVNGTATVDTDGKTIIYVPDASFDGNDTVVYEITDAYGRTSQATLYITVNPQAGTSCQVITAGFVASLSVQSGGLQIALQNTTNYLTNIPTSNAYVIEIRDSSNNVLHTYLETGRNDGLAQIYSVPDALDNAWDNVKISQTVVSEDDLGNTCGTVISNNTYTMPNINVSIFAGVDVSCMGVSNTDPDTAILQAIVDGVCNPNVTADNGLEMDGNEVILGGELNKNTSIVGDYDLTMSVRTFGNESSPDKDNYTALVGKNRRNVESGDDFNAVGATGQMFVRFFEDTDLDLMYHPFFAGHLSQLEVVAKDDTDDNTRANINQSKSKHIGSAGIVGHLITTRVSAETGKCKIDRVTGEYISRITKPLNSDVEVETFIQHYLAKQDHDGGGGGRTVFAVERYGYYQEGSGTVNYFGGDILMDGLKNKSSLATDVDGVIIDGASDERLKENIQDLQVGLDEVLKLRAVEYNFKKETKRGSENRIGFIAQEVREVVPELIEGAETETEYLNVKYQEAVPLLVKAIQELSAKVDSLQNEINELKS